MLVTMLSPRLVWRNLAVAFLSLFLMASAGNAPRAVEDDIVDVVFINHYDGEAQLFWISEEGIELSASDVMRKGDEMGMSTHIGHEFFARDSATSEVIASYKIHGQSEILINSETTCYSSTGSSCPAHPTDQTSLDRAVRARENNDKFRQKMNIKQPPAVPKFTSMGYAKTTFPDYAWRQLRTFYDNNKFNMREEYWDLTSTYVNHWEADFRFIPITEKIRAIVFNSVMPILEEWSGEKLEPTACYGIRVYTNNSYLLMHVDRVETHAISAIINIDQDVVDPWPLVIQSHYDTGDNQTKVYIEPKGLILYESSSCLHGRPIPFHGNYFANVFVHFRPKKNWNFDGFYSKN